LFGLFGVMVGIGQQQAMGIVVGIGLTVLGVLWFRSKKPTYSVRLTSASGESEAYSSGDKDFVGKIVNAINDAIVHRG